MVLFETSWLYKETRYGEGKFYGALKSGLVINRDCLDWWYLPEDMDAIKFIVYNRAAKERAEVKFHTGNPGWVRVTTPGKYDKFAKLLTGDLRAEAWRVLEQSIKSVHVELYYLETL